MSKELLIESFFKIRGNEQIKKLNLCKEECERFLLKNKDSEITDLISVINALTTYFETDNKEVARKFTINLWCSLYNKDELSLFEIRILNCILFTELKVEKIIENAEDYLLQLENYQYHKDYIKIKISINANLLDLLIDARHFNKYYQNSFDVLIPKIIKEIININLRSGFNNKYFIGLASIYQGIFFKDESSIYIGTLLLENSHKESNQNTQDLIEFYKRKYKIVV